MAPKIVPPVKLPVPGDPPHPLREGEGEAELSIFYPQYTVTLDAGVFMWIWRIVENKALLMFTNPAMVKLFPNAVGVGLRAVESFRRASGQTIERVADPSKGRKKVLKRR